LRRPRLCWFLVRRRIAQPRPASSWQPVQALYICHKVRSGRFPSTLQGDPPGCFRASSIWAVRSAVRSRRLSPRGSPSGRAGPVHSISLLCSLSWLQCAGSSSILNIRCDLKRMESTRCEPYGDFDSRHKGSFGSDRHPQVCLAGLASIYHPECCLFCCSARSASVLARRQLSPRIDLLAASRPAIHPSFRRQFPPIADR
jgi:hypothetical protein